MSDSQVDVARYYNNGMSWEEFLAQAKDGVDRMRAFYDEFDFDEDTLAFFNGRTPLQVLAIVEDWCPDVLQNVAMLARIADEVPGMELSLVLRDKNPELMNEFLTDGKKRIPVIAFFDMAMRDIGHWTGRCKAADEWIFREVLQNRTRDWMDMDEQELADFNKEYDRRFRDSYARESLAEWQNLLSDEEY